MSENLKIAKEIEVGFELTPDLPIVYRQGQWQLRVENNRLLFGISNDKDEALVEAERLACLVLTVLKHTPLSGAGVNFTFIVDQPTDELIRLFKSEDKDELGREGWDIQQWKLMRQMVRGDTMLNLHLTLSKSVVSVECNFHTSATNCDAAVHAIQDKVLSYKSDALTVLQNVYHLSEDTVNVWRDN